MKTMNMEFYSEEFARVSDFPLAVTLATKFPVLAIDKVDPRRACFLFRHTGELDKIVEAYHRRELRIEPQEYHLRSRELKSRLYATV